MALEGELLSLEGMKERVITHSLREERGPGGKPPRV